MIEVVVLAGGAGKRLRGVVSDVPKPMAPVGGKPFLDLVLSSLENKGIREVVLSVGYKAEKIIDYFGSSYRRLQISYAREKEPLGTGGAIKCALNYVKGDTALVINGDTFLDLEIRELLQTKNTTRNSIIVARQTKDAERFGTISFSGAKVTSFSEKLLTGPAVINAGVYLLSRSELDAFDVGQRFSLEEEYLPKACEQGKFNIFISRGDFLDIGTPEDYLRAESHLANYIDV